jgi:hypothetical protein
VLHGEASCPAFLPPFKEHGHSIEAISELKQILANLRKPRLPRELPDFFGGLAVVLPLGGCASLTMAPPGASLTPTRNLSAYRRVPRHTRSV